VLEAVVDAGAKASMKPLCCEECKSAVVQRRHVARTGVAEDLVRIVMIYDDVLCVFS
jgi:hypothetical protein